MQAVFEPPFPVNESVREYRPGSEEVETLQNTIRWMKKKRWDLPMTINGQEVYTKIKVEMHPPHEIEHTLGVYNKGDQAHAAQAVKAALEARKSWAVYPWQERAAIFLKAAELISGPMRNQLNASTMLCQSKTVHQSEIDAVCELADFLRFNVYYMTQMYRDQPDSDPGEWNQLEYRPLEGFVLAITPFNFTAISGNLPSAPALMGNTVVWKPADSQIFSAYFVMQAFKKAGLPDGVINLIYGDGPDIGNVVFNHREFAGLHYTGSTTVFKSLWKMMANNLDRYKSFPRIVGETGGKDFLIAHKSADPLQVASALSRGAFEFQGQKCSAVSRAYLSSSLWDDIKKHLLSQLAAMKQGSVEDFENFVSAVIDEKAFNKITGYIEFAREADQAQIIAGGGYSKDSGYFIEPTVIWTEDPHFKTMEEEIFGPVLTMYVFDDEKYDETLDLLDSTSPYGLTGAVFSADRTIIRKTTDRLKYAAGNFYINDKPTGAVVGQQPFGGGRASGTNDKAGSILNLFRWVSPRTIKENFTPANDFRYPFMGD